MVHFYCIYANNSLQVSAKKGGIKNNTSIYEEEEEEEAAAFMRL